jgi:hypothetical protein
MFGLRRHEYLAADDQQGSAPAASGSIDQQMELWNQAQESCHRHSRRF